MRRSEMKKVYRQMLDFYKEDKVRERVKLAAHYRKLYPAGTRIKLIRRGMETDAPMKPSTFGTVSFVDDAGLIHMRWDNGSRYALVPGEDVFQVIELPTRGVKNE